MTTPDSELLQEFACNRSEKIFATLVSRHVDLVYSAALRQVRSPQLAEEVAQTVFLDLSRNAEKFAPDTILTAWLYRVTRRAAIDVVRSESRRQLREQIAVELAVMNSPDTHWKEIEPLLDEAMDTLDETDRTSVLLRYFENKSLREVGERLGTSDDAAQKRVSRAVERLREFFSKRGVTIGASGVAIAISGNAIQAAPIGFALTISSALAGSTLASATTATAIKTIAMTTLQKSLITAVIIAAVGTGIYQARQASRLRGQVESLKQAQQSGPADELQQLASERNSALSQLNELREENERLNRNSAELIRLRGEVGRLRESERKLVQLKAEESTDPAQIAMKSWLTRVNRLKERVQRSPEQNIPELQLVSEQDWLNAAHGKLETEEDFRRAMSTLRGTAENKIASLLQPALKKYIDANDGKFPTDLSELQPYFKTPLNPTILQRYGIFPADEVPNVKMGGNWIITVKAPIDEDYDSRFAVGPNGFGTSGNEWKPNPKTGLKQKELAFLIKVLSSPLNNYKESHQGNEPSDPSQLLPYLTTPEQKASLEKLIQAAGKTGGK